MGPFDPFLGQSLVKSLPYNCASDSSSLLSEAALALVIDGKIAGCSGIALPPGRAKGCCGGATGCGAHCGGRGGGFRLGKDDRSTAARLLSLLERVLQAWSDWTLPPLLHCRRSDNEAVAGHCCLLSSVVVMIQGTMFITHQFSLQVEHTI